MKQTLLTLVAASLPLTLACAGAGTQTSAPPPAASAAAATENVPQVITGLENDWVKAIVAADTATIDRIIADDFIGTTDDVQYNKADAIAGVRNVTYEALELSNITAHVYGDTVVATMDQNEKSRQGSHDFSGHYLFTNVWVKRDGQWRAVASHGSRTK